MSRLDDSRARAAISQRLALLTPGTPPQWGRMTAHQAVCHLSDAFLLPLGRKSASVNSSALQRTLVKWIALYAPLTWPKGVPTRPEMEQGVGGTPPYEFERDRAQLAALIGEFTALRTFSAEHPVFGRLTPGEWMRWGFRHADHHLRQFGV